MPQDSHWARRAVRRLIVDPFLFLFALLFAMYPASLALQAMQWGADKHWSIGLAVSVACALLVLWAVVELRTRAQADDVRAMVANLVLAALMASIVCGWCSFTIWTSTPTAYESAKQRSLATAIEHYTWLFFETIPGLKVTEALSWEASLRPRTFLAGLPVLAFRAFVLLCLVNIVQQWWKKRDTLKASTPSTTRA